MTLVYLRFNRNPGATEVFSREGCDFDSRSAADCNGQADGSRIRSYCGLLRPSKIAACHHAIHLTMPVNDVAMKTICIINRPSALIWTAYAIRQMLDNSRKCQP